MTLDATALLAIQRRADGWERLVARVIEAGNARVPATGGAGGSGYGAGGRGQHARRAGPP